MNRLTHKKTLPKDAVKSYYGYTNFLHFISDERKEGLNNEKLTPLRDLPFYIPIRF